MTIDELKKRLSQNCSFTIEGSCGCFEVNHDRGKIHVEDVASAPSFYSLTVGTVDELVSRMEVGGVRLTDCLDRIRFK